jgi:hypothetical protein
MELEVSSTTKRKSAVLAPNVWKPFHPGASMEHLRKLVFHGDLDDCHICFQGELRNSKF